MCYDRMRLYSTLFSWFMFPNSSKSPLLPPSKQGSPMIVPVYNVTLASWLHKSPKIRLFVSKLILSKKPSNLCITGPLWLESTGYFAYGAPSNAETVSMAWCWYANGMILPTSFKVTLVTLKDVSKISLYQIIYRCNKPRSVCITHGVHVQDRLSNLQSLLNMNLYSTWHEFDPDTAYMVCISVSLGFPYMVSISLGFPYMVMR